MRGRGVFLVLVNLSSAFDTVDHDILLGFMKDSVDVDETVMAFFQSFFLTNHSVSTSGVLSECSELVHGVPQGCVPGPIVFCICTPALDAILRNYNIKYQIYADDTQLYWSFNLKSPLVAIEKIQSCVSASGLGR